MIVINPAAWLGPTAYLVLDATGKILEANEVACQLLRRPRHLLRQRGLATFVQPADRPAFARHLVEAAAGTPKARPIQVTLEGPPLRIVRLETVSEAGLDGGGRNHRTTLIDVTEQLLAAQQLQAERLALERSQATLRALARRLMFAEENERRRVAADLHDDVGQRLHALQMELVLFERRLSGHGELSAQARTIHRQLEQVVTDLEGVARSLHPKIVDDLGLSVALRAHAHDVERQSGMVVRFRERRVPGVVPADLAVCLYRVAQEALRNVRRHAGTQTATVTLARVRRGIGLCVADGGRGFAEEKVRVSGRGLGLATMRERVSAVDGFFRIRTNPGDGTHVHAWVPLP